MSKVGVKIPSDDKITTATTTTENKNNGLNGLVNGDSRKVGRKKGGGKVIQNHRKDSDSKEVVAGTKPKKKSKNTPKQEDGVVSEELQELTKLDLCSIINRSREPVASCSSAVNTETLIDDLKDLNLDTELSDIACAAEMQTVTTEKETPKEELKELPPVDYVQYESELQMPMIMKLIQKDLSEPYSIYTYRYFIHNWPKLCFLVGPRLV